MWICLDPTSGARCVGTFQAHLICAWPSTFDDRTSCQPVVPDRPVNSSAASLLLAGRRCPATLACPRSDRPRPSP